MMRYDAVMGTYAKHGARLDPHERERPAAPRDKAGKLEYWTREAQRDIDDLDLWAAIGSLDRLSKAREQCGRSGTSALWTALVLMCQCRLAFTMGQIVRRCEEFGDPIEGELGWWLEIDSFREPGRTFDDMIARIAERKDREIPLEVLPGVEGICLLASPEDCLEGLAGGKEVSKRVFQRLTERLRASWTPG